MLLFVSLRSFLFGSWRPPPGVRVGTSVSVRAWTAAAGGIHLDRVPCVQVACFLASTTAENRALFRKVIGPQRPSLMHAAALVLRAHREKSAALCKPL
jgi:hypothetical protein